jgi:hypothetical protein
MNSQEIISLCDRAEALAPQELPPTLSAKSDLLGAPEWYQFERDSWPIGEKIRQALAATPSLKKNEAIQERIIRVVENRNLRRGRQSFVMALAYAAAANISGRLVPFLSDPDIDGQVVNTLLKMRAMDFSAQVRPLLQSDKSWIRKEAKRYLERAIGSR